MLTIKNFHVYVEKKHIVKGVSLSIKRANLHILMGPNGSGKSSLAQALMGKPDYNVKSRIELDGQNIVDLYPDERARAGLFLAFQQPVSVPGVNIVNFLKLAQNKTEGMGEFVLSLKKQAKKLQIKEGFLKRGLNEDFSGGEKKKLEMLQMLVLQPKYAVIDEIDTGLDVDALKLVAKGIKQVIRESKTGILLITHYQRILKYLKPNFVQIMKDGKIVKSGDCKLARQVEKNGYKNF